MKKLSFLSKVIGTFGSRICKNKIEKVIKMNMNTTLKQQLKKHQDTEARKAKIKNLEERLNTLLSNEQIKDCIKESLSLGFSAYYDSEDFLAILDPCKSSEVVAFNNAYEFAIFLTQEQAESKKEKKLYRFQAYISKLPDALNVKILTFSEDDISESDVLNCLIQLIGYETYKDSATLVELLEQEKANKEVEKAFVSGLSNLVNTKEINEILSKALESKAPFNASLLLDGYNIVLDKSMTMIDLFRFYVAELGNDDVSQGILKSSVATISVEFKMVKNKKEENVESDSFCDFELKDNKSISLYRYAPGKISSDKALEYFKKVIGVNI